MKYLARINEAVHHDAEFRRLWYHGYWHYERAFAERWVTLQIHGWSIFTPAQNRPIYQHEVGTKRRKQGVILRS